MKAVLLSRFVVVSPNTTVLPPCPGGPSQMRRLTASMVDVVVEPVW